MGTKDFLKFTVLLALCVLLETKSIRRRNDVSFNRNPLLRGGFNRGAVESSPVAAPKSAALRDALDDDEFGTKRLPLRAAVESIPPRYQRIQASSSGRIPMRDAVERRPPAYDDDLFALTDELESLGIDPWMVDNKPQKKPDKYQDETHNDAHHYVIQLPSKDRGEYSQLHHNKPTLRNGYYGAASPYNMDTAWQEHYAAYQPGNNRTTMDRFSVNNQYQQIITYPKYWQNENYGQNLRAKVMQDKSKPMVVCYVESWSTYRKAPMSFSPASLPPLCTHVLYAFATLHPETFQITSNDNEYDVIQGGYRVVTGLKMHQPDLKVLISVGGDRWSSARRMSQLVEQPSRRSAFIRSVIEFCRTHGFDGVDLHWQYPGAEDFGGNMMDKKNLIALLKEMKAAFDPEDLIISMAVPGSRYRIEDGYDVSSIQEYVQWITLEAFDFRVDRESCSIADHHTPLFSRPRDKSFTDVFFNVDYSLKYWLKSGMPSDKIVLGMPMFGRSFTLENQKNFTAGSRASGLGNEGEYTQTKGFMAYFEICDIMASGDWRRYIDEVGSPYIVSGDQWIGYDDVDSIMMKVNYINKMNLAGGAVWAADMDDFRGLCGKPWPLLSTLSNGLNGMSAKDFSERTRSIGYCKEYEDGFSSDPKSCGGYFLCRKGLKYRLHCHEGTLYDSETSICKIMDPSKCLPGQSIKSLFSENYEEESFNIMDNTQEYHQLKVAKRDNVKKVMCYLANWALYRKAEGKFVPEHTDTRLCTHLIYAYASLHPDNLIAKESDPWADLDNNLYARTTALKDVVVLLGLGGWTDSAGDKYSKMVSTEFSRKTFITNLIPFLKRHGFRGLHLDWNYPKCWQSNCAKGPASDKENFAKLVQEISEEFKRQSPVMELGIAISGYKEVIDMAYDLPSLGQSADFLSAMIFDFHGGWESVTSHGSPLYSRPGDIYPQYTADNVIKYLISKGVPAEKILFGITFYGQTFKLSTSTGRSTFGPGSPAVGPGDPGELTKQPGMLAYYEICNAVKNLRWHTGRQEGAGPYAYNKDQWVGYEDTTSITEKVEYAKQKNLGGIFAWTMDLDDFNNVCCGEPFPLLRAINRALGRTSPAPPTFPCDRPSPPATPEPPVLTTNFDTGASTTNAWTSSPISQTTTSPWWMPDKTSTTPSTTTSPWWMPDTSTTSTTTTTMRTTTTTMRTTTTTIPTSTTTPITSTTPSSILSAESCVPGSYSPDPTDCGYYITCIGNERHRQPCAPGLHFSAAVGICDWPAIAKCDARNAMPASDFMPTTTTSTTMFTTRRTTQNPIISQMTTERTTTNITPSKKPTHKPMKKPNREPQVSCQNGAYYPHKDCNKFNICINNHFAAQLCGGGLAWNQQLMLCDTSNQKLCSRKLNKPSLKNYASLLNAPCQVGQYSIHPNDCQKYQMCVWGKFEIYSCGSGLHWNKNTNTCDWPLNAQCQSSPGIESDFIVPVIPTNDITTSTSRPIFTTQSDSLIPQQPITTTEATPFKPLSSDYIVVCYFTNWAWYRRGIGKYVPEDIDPSLCTHIVYGFAVLDYDKLVIKAHDSWADFDNRFYERVTAFKKKGLKVTLALGGWNDSAGDKYSRLVNNPDARKRFIEHAVGFLEKYDFDGLDLDWEYPQCWQTDCSKGPETDKAAFRAWVEELSAAFKPRGLLLSAAVSASKTIVDAGYDVPALADKMDWIAVMTYDFHGQWDKKTGHVAPLYYHPDDDVVFFNANYSINYWISQGAPPKKLVMGIPLYGQSFTRGVSWDTPQSQLVNKDGHGLNVPARAGGQAGEYTGASGFLSYYEICDRINNRQWIVEQDEDGLMGPHAYKDDQWVSYDDVNIIKKKTEYMKSMNLLGAMIWALDLDDFRDTCKQGRHPLLNAIREVLENPTIQELPSGGIPDKSEMPKPEIPREPDIIKPPIEAVEAEEESPEQNEVYGDVGSGYKMVCYFTNWAWYRQGIGKYLPADIDPSLCTHIVYGFAVLDTQNLIIKPHDTWADIDNKFYEKVTALRAKGVKVLLAIGGWNDSAGDKYSRLVNSPSARRRFILHVLDFIRNNNFDGLDLDWEYPVCWQVECTKGPSSDKEGFSALVQELRDAFRPYNLLLSAAVSPNKKVIDAGYDVPVLSENLDWIAVMTYDYHGQWDKKTGHVAPMYEHSEDSDETFNTNYTINYWISQGADPLKLLLGIPSYGQSFSLASSDENGLNAPTYGGGEAGDHTRARGFLSYYEIYDRIKNRQWNVVRDPRGKMGPYAYKGDQWVSFDDIGMIQHKCLYVKAMGLGGGMIWALDLDDFMNISGCERYPLLSAAARVLDLIKTPQPDCPLDAVAAELPEYTTKKPAPPLQTPIEVPTIKPVVVQQPLPISPVSQPCLGRIFAADPIDCNKFYLCNQGTLLQQSCPPTLHWMEDHCDWPSNSKCKAQQPVSSIIPITSAPVVPQQPIVTTSKPQYTKPSKYKVICYFTNWAWYRQGEGKYTPEDIQEDLCTHIAYSFAVLDHVTLTIKPHDTWADIDNDFYGKVTALRAKGKKVVIAIGGWNDSLGDKYSRLVNNPGARARFITNVVSFIDKWHFDGLDLDWEYPRCWQVDCNAGPASDKEGFAKLVQELRQAFKPRGWLLSAAVSASRAVIDVAYDVPSLSRNLDWIAVMTYDYHGHWDKKTGHVSPLFYYPGDSYDYFNTNYSINYWIEKGASPEKLILGIPTYGQSLTLLDNTNHGLNVPASGPGEAGEFTKAPGFLAYYEICYRIKHAGWSVYRDSKNRVGPWASRGIQWVSFDDTKMASRKTELVKSMGLGGAMIWALDLDDYQNRCGCGRHPLLRAINAVLRSQSPLTCNL